MSCENSIELLWKGAQTFQGGKHTHELLKSYYINICRKLSKYNLQIPKEKFAISQMCPHCGCFWHESKYGLKLINKQIKCKSKDKRLIEKFEAKSTAKALSKREKNRAKWLKKKVSNHLAIVCHQCRHRSVLKMEKPESKSNPEKSNFENKFHGGMCATKSEMGLETDGKQEKKKHQGNIKLARTLSIPKELKKMKEQSVKICQSKKKEKKHNVSSNNVISKTQKQNTLLQMAALLHKQTKVDSRNSSQKRLQSFLK